MILRALNPSPRMSSLVRYRSRTSVERARMMDSLKKVHIEDIIDKNPSKRQPHIHPRSSAYHAISIQYLKTNFRNFFPFRPKFKQNCMLHFSSRWRYDHSLAGRISAVWPRCNSVKGSVSSSPHWLTHFVDFSTYLSKGIKANSLELPAQMPYLRGYMEL